MSFITPELAKKIRLQGSEVVTICEGLVKIRVGKLDGATSFEGTGHPERVKFALLIGACLTDDGRQLFANEEEVTEFLKSISIDDLTTLIEKITEKTKKLKEKKEATEASGEAPTLAAT